MPLTHVKMVLKYARDGHSYLSEHNKAFRFFKQSLTKKNLQWGPLNSWQNVSFGLPELPEDRENI